MVVAFVTALIAAAEPNVSRANLTANSNGIMGDYILKALNDVRDSKINPAIAENISDPLEVDVEKSGGADAGCIIPSPISFGARRRRCICHASASYSVSMKNVKGLKALRVTNFTTASVSWDMSTITVGADVVDDDVEVDGGAHAGVSACHISPHASGSASTHARITKTHLTAFATGEFDWLHECVNLRFTKVTVVLNEVSIHDTSVKIAPIPGVGIGTFVDLVLDIAPDLTTEITKAVQGPLSKAITNAAAKGDLPCIKIPMQAFPSDDALVV